MSRFVRSSKYRHVFGKEAKRDDSYDQIKVTRSAWDSNYIDAGTKFWACIWEAGGGGAFVVKRHEDTGKGTANPPLVAGHKASVLDIEFSPFNPYLIASASEDCMVKIWQIPEDGLTDTMTEEAQLLKGHRRKTGNVKWHPTALNVLSSSSTDYLVKIWDVETGQAQCDLKGHSNIIQTMDWSYNGSQMVTASKDKKLRLFDPRVQDSVQEWAGHAGVKGQRAIFCGDTGLICSVGFSRSSDRQYYIWDPAMTDKPLCKKNVDTSSGQFMAWFDNDTKMLWIAGKVDGNIRYFELEQEGDKTSVYDLSQFKSSTPQKGLCLLPKRAVDVPKCEVAKFLKVTPKNMVVPISMTVPRKSELFQDDIFPDAYAGVATNTAEGYFGGQDTDPELVSMEPDESTGKKSDAPVVATSFKKQEAEKELTPKEIKEEWEALKKRVAYLEAEITKKDARIKELEG